jgi:hypothetical protein
LIKTPLCANCFDENYYTDPKAMRDKKEEMHLKVVLLHLFLVLASFNYVII